MTRLTLLALFALACGAPTADTPAAEVTSTENTAVQETGDEAPPTSAAITVTHISGTEAAPATAYEGPATSVTTRLEDGALRVSLSNFVFYCRPAPTFAARLEGDVLVLQAEAPQGAVTRCVGPHSAELKIEGVSGNVLVSVRNTNGDEVATTR